ncbi:MAG TPA: glycosyltransferase [Burkholderiaceae bacterium]|nr:glycosyltransferase [Burkholderiaceae bacterium]
MNSIASHDSIDTFSTEAARLPLPLPIARPYLLVLFSVPFYIDASGRRWIDALWAKDLLGHTRYIKRLTLAATTIRGPAPANSIAIDTVPGLAQIVCVDLPRATSTGEALTLLPRTLSILWKSLRHVAIVHTSVAAWPLPEAWVMLPLLVFRRRPLYINVESAFWRLVPGQPAGRGRRLRAAVTERLNRFCLGHSDISTFTSEGYKRSLLKSGAERGHVIEASWIDEANLIPESALNARITAGRSLAPLKLVFAGRLDAAKGILVLLDAVAEALQAGAQLDLEIYGAGTLEAEVARRIAIPDLAPHVRLCGSLPYGPLFFETLRRYDALVAPILSDEQPRIVFDAFSQGLPVLASRTPGLAQCVREGVTGIFDTPGDVHALAKTLSRVAANREIVQQMAPACLARAKQATHRGMHEARWRLLTSKFPSLTREH